MQTKSPVRTPHASTAQVVLHPDQPLSAHLADRTRALISDGQVQLRSVDGQGARERAAMVAAGVQLFVPTLVRATVGGHRVEVRRDPHLLPTASCTCQAASFGRRCSHALAAWGWPGERQRPTGRIDRPQQPPLAICPAAPATRTSTTSCCGSRFVRLCRWPCRRCKHPNRHGGARPLVRVVLLRHANLDPALLFVAVDQVRYGFPTLPLGQRRQTHAGILDWEQHQVARGFVQRAGLRVDEPPHYARAVVAGRPVLLVGGGSARPYPLGTGDLGVRAPARREWFSRPTRIHCPC
jgi:hypothetical protein